MASRVVSKLDESKAASSVGGGVVVGLEVEEWRDSSVAS